MAYKKIFDDKIKSKAIVIDKIREVITEAYSKNKITKLQEVNIETYTLFFDIKLFKLCFSN